MQTLSAKIKAFVVAHKILSSFILIIILGVSYWSYKKATNTSGIPRYITGIVEKATIVASISGTGQVSDINQIDIKPKVSGDVVYVGAQNGAKVSAGTLILEIDPTDAQKSVRDAQTSLASTQLSLEKLKIQNSTDNLSADSVKVYSDGFNTVSDTFLDLPIETSGLEDVMAGSNLSADDARVVSKTAETYRSIAENARFDAKHSFDITSKSFAVLDSTSPRQDIENIIEQTYQTTKLFSDAVKAALDFVAYMANQSNNPGEFSSAQTTLAGYLSTANGHLADLLIAQKNIKGSQDTSQNANLDIQSAELSVQEKQNALQDAKDKLADYFVRAPFAGVLANMDIKKADTVSTGTAVGTLITNKQIAEVSMNEVDVAKIKIGEKTTLTFDAVPDLTIAGTVEEIDAIGTVSQGVVTYNVKITFDTQDDRIKPSMSVSAAIITDMKEDVLAVPNSAIKSQGGQSYVEMFDKSLLPLPAPTDGLPGSPSTMTPNRIPVETGISNDTLTEIVSGLNEGDEIITRTIAGTTTATTAPSIFGGGVRAGGGATGGTRIRTN